METEQCPICHTFPAKTRNEFRKHVGGHLLQIALACIPGTDHCAEDNSSEDEDSDAVEEETKTRFEDTKRTTLLTGSLAEELIKNRIEWPPGKNSHFIPNGVTDDLLTPENIRAELIKIHGNNIARIDYYTEEIYRSRTKLFTVLITGFLEDKGGQYSIRNFIDHDVDDTDLPFSRCRGEKNNKGFELCSRGVEVPAKVMNNWSAKSKMSFYDDQWTVLAPTFESEKGEIRHYEFEPNILLPFREDYENNTSYMEAGGYSRVWPVKVVAGHQKIYIPTDTEVSFVLEIVFSLLQ